MTELKKRLTLESHFKKQDFDIMYFNPLPSWEHWLKYSFARKDIKLLNECNYRCVLASEIILDIEIKDRQNLQDIISKLKKEDYTFTVWDSGGKGYHIHLFFPELLKMTPEKRQFVKEAFIKDYGADTSKKSERNMIGLEYAPHRSTGRIKRPYNE